MIGSVPIRFEGSREEAALNYRTHFWLTFDDEIRCGDCDCRPSHAAADYPCGVEPPRETTKPDNDIRTERAKCLDTGWYPARAADHAKNPANCPHCGIEPPREVVEPDPWDGWFMPGYATELDYMNACEADDYRNESGDF